MIVCECCLMAVIGILGIYVTVTDIRRGIIKNKCLLLAVVLGTGINIGYYTRFAEGFLSIYVHNLLAMSILSILLYGLHFWAAGDSKLLIVVTFLFPARFYDTGYQMVVPGIYCVVLIFLLAYFYVLGDSVYQYVRGGEFHHSIKMSVASIKMFLKQYAMSFLYLHGLSQLLQKIFSDFYYENQVLFTFFNLFFAVFIQTKEIFRRKTAIWIVIGLNAVLFLLTERIAFQPWMLRSYGILFFVLILRYFVSGYNYQEIPTKEVAKGMVLSYGTVAKFLPSRVKGLPRQTNEDMRCRITEEETRAIKRWESSKYGEDTIVIVRKIPFAIFIICGTFIFFGIRMFVS
ncbi:MAG TPA: prepilin peptidase [Candidatus Anaerostipes excrementavium]|uniref:Prepilin peptidase n=1 Tax=Candidatus Anaerostipes excrementavium TaxID=2838463 RepID=A0A9D2B8W7_9FIRM|nr:prepilin peptidase [uncultured Anaerostipes sp.]HIX66524.1 prepilin peptidase [Candidatus Anaerostipes excrementavium]